MFDKFKKAFASLKPVEKTEEPNLPPIPAEPEPVEPEPSVVELESTLTRIDPVPYTIYTHLPEMEDDYIFYDVQRVLRSPAEALEEFNTPPEFYEDFGEEWEGPKTGWTKNKFGTSYYSAQVEISEDTIKVFSGGNFIGEVRPERYRRILRFLNSSLHDGNLYLIVQEGPQWVYHAGPPEFVELNDKPFSIALAIGLVEMTTAEQKAEFDRLQAIPENEEDWTRIDRLYESSLFKPIGIGKNNPKRIKDLIYSTNYAKLKQSELFKDQWTDKLLKGKKPRKWLSAYPGNHQISAYQAVWTDQVQIEEANGKLAVKSGDIIFGYLTPSTTVAKNYKEADYIWLEVRGGPEWTSNGSSDYVLQDKPFRVNLHIASM